VQIITARIASAKMVACKIILPFMASLVHVFASEVYVMLPLDLVTNDGHLKDQNALASQLDQLKNANVDGVATDVWWGVTEKSPKKYTFDAYQQVVEMVKSRGMKAKLMASFHQCGGNVGDTCNIPLPSFVTGTSDVWYKDKAGHEDKEYISSFADNVKISGRTPLEMYSDWLDAFASTFAKDLGTTIPDVQVSMGPAGELRYPAYQLSQWHFCGVGGFQAFDKNAIVDFRAAAVAAGHHEWNSPPTDAGDYNSKPEQTSFFNGGYSSEYGKFFLDWYFGNLKRHGDAVLKLSRAALGTKVGVAGKIAGIHWWYKAPHHAAELTAGYYNANQRDAYAELAAVFAPHKAAMDFTCLEMRDSEQDQSCASGPEELVRQVISAASSKALNFNGENALPRYDNTAYSEIESYRSNLHAFTYLRLSGTLLQGDNLNNFRNFANTMHAGNAGSIVV
jgi:beta-amylase